MGREKRNLSFEDFSKKKKKIKNILTFEKKFFFNFQRINEGRILDFFGVVKLIIPSPTINFLRVSREFL